MVILHGSYDVAHRRGHCFAVCVCVCVSLCVCGFVCVFVCGCTIFVSTKVLSWFAKGDVAGSVDPVMSWAYYVWCTSIALFALFCFSRVDF